MRLLHFWVVDKKNTWLLNVRPTEKINRTYYLKNRNRKMDFFGRFLTGPLVIIYWGLGLWGLFLNAQYIYDGMGLIGIIVGLFIFPIVYVLTPLYAGFSDGYWLPAMVSYAPFAVMVVFSISAAAFDRS